MKAKRVTSQGSFLFVIEGRSKGSSVLAHQVHKKDARYVEKRDRLIDSIPGPKKKS